MIQMTPTEIEREFKYYIALLDKNYFKCGKKNSECNHKDHIIHMMRKAFWAGYELGYSLGEEE